MKRTPGFTLIELLVVISIIALLISILLPALGTARAAAENVQCLSNERQIGTLYYTYMADHKEKFPGPNTYGAKGVLNAFRNAGYYDYDATEPGSQSLNWCPSTDPVWRSDPNNTYFSNVGNPWNIPGLTKFDANYHSYAANTDLKPWVPGTGTNNRSLYYGTDATLAYFPTTFKASPGRVVLLGDGPTYFTGVWDANNNGKYYSPFYNYATRHMGGFYGDPYGSANMLLGDGHAETLAAEAINPDYQTFIDNGMGTTTGFPAENSGSDLVWLYGGYGSFSNYFN